MNVDRKYCQEIYDISELIEVSIERIKYYKNRLIDNKNICAFSGGKDSVVIYVLMALSGIEFTPIYSQTSMDPPELVNFIRHEFNPWAKKNDYPEVIFNPYNKFSERRAEGKMTGKPITMYSLIANRAIYPSRGIPYCCSELKERTGDKGDTVYVGVRWEESNKRKKSQLYSTFLGKHMMRPIIDWTKDDVWCFILKNNIPYCSLYDNGWDRVGCIGCPKTSSKNRIAEFEAYPKYKANIIRALDKMLFFRENKYGADYNGDWLCGQDVFDTWLELKPLTRKAIKSNNSIENDLKEKYYQIKFDCMDYE